MLCLSLAVAHASVQPENTKLYTVENPLIYEDACDLWPYSYLNDEGNPEGFNIDLIERLMKELNIPYVIRLKPQQEVFQDLKAGKATSLSVWQPASTISTPAMVGMPSPSSPRVSPPLKRKR